jgi:hypothetical protein
MAYAQWQQELDRLERTRNINWEDFFQRYVEVNQSEMERMRGVYNNLKVRVKRVISQHLPFQVRKFIDRGSSFENLKVLNPNEFDCLVRIQPSGSLQRQSDGRRITVQTSGPSSSSAGQGSPGSGIFRADNVRHLFQSALQKFITANQGQGGFSYKLSTHGPATTMEVQQHGRFLFSVDFVPLLVVADVWMIAKPHQEAGTEHMWMRTSCKEEAHWAFNISPQYRKVLMIFKVLRLWKHSQMGMLSSYCYKTAFLRWYHQEKYRSPSLASLIVDFMNYLEKELRGRSLKTYPNDEFNLLEDINPISLDNLASFIQNLAKKLPQQ